ncbi:C-di-GMP-specific phosphodiesterase [Gracilibacillus halophilus YIM-C55.5]|uniref:C-di-GMP-specific phosphodiesterase n=1 Tax=Gracilibacillus halophilus YIM-C55.5 TaxID=1308866 RepID=N4WXX1_9BACI|nr:EAL domain-containing protein [Gracilibacillus halophilus]ENH97916.1 C-di-GMP-specific phosphodiesterase [Gracilibacillus halophilus YIM-C55.5]
MDPLDVMLHLDRVKPYFQAILSADSHQVTGYEVLGRIEQNGQITSLGSFFHDPHVPEEFKMEVDQHIQSIAVDVFKQVNPDAYLYMNIQANYVTMNGKYDLVEQFLEYQDNGMDLSKIVLEVTEQDFDGDMSQLTNALKYLQTLGVQIAIDDLGKEQVI